MSVIVTDAGFGPDAWEGRVQSVDILGTGQEFSDEPIAVEIPVDRDPADLAPWLDWLAMIRVAFPTTADGRGFSIARRLRAMGFTGRLRAAGPLIADQYRAARRVGFDEVEVPDAVAARQPETMWIGPARPSYRDRLTG